MENSAADNYMCQLMSELKYTSVEYCNWADITNPFYRSKSIVALRSVVSIVLYPREHCSRYAALGDWESNAEISRLLEVLFYLVCFDALNEAAAVYTRELIYGNYLSIKSGKQ